MTPSITEDMVAIALRDFIIAVVPGPIDVIQGQPNRVPAPTGPRYVIFTPTGRRDLSTTRHTYDSDEETRETDLSVEFTWQVNFYGEGSSNDAQAVWMMFRDEYGCQFMAPYFVRPLDHSPPRQLPLVDGEKQYQERWMIEMRVQANPAIVTVQQFADIVTANTIEVDGMEV